MLWRASCRWRATAGASTLRSGTWCRQSCQTRSYAEGVRFGGRRERAGIGELKERNKGRDVHFENGADDGLRHRHATGTGLGVVVTDNAHKTGIEALLERIKPGPTSDEPQSSTSAITLVLLLTPSYAIHASDGELPLKVLQSLRPGNESTSTPFDAVTAVVDRLPAPETSISGLEGLAYMLLRDTTPLSAASRKPFNPLAQKPGSVSFEIPSGEWGSWSSIVQLPLAQTIFSTGKISTMVHSQYHFDETAQQLSRSTEADLESQTLRLPSPIGRHGIFTRVPLLPLTPFRTIRQSMGNIIRAVSHSAETHPAADGAQPASQELEAAVTEYFKVCDMAPEPVQVWALVIPGNKTPGSDSSSESAWTNIANRGGAQRMLHLNAEQIRAYWRPTSADQSSQQMVNTTVRRILRYGGRLCRVLSGGGGWGKKAGLLSLDPDVEYSSRDLRHDEGWEFDFEGDAPDAAERSKKQALGEIVKEGESVMFLLALKQNPGKVDGKDDGNGMAYTARRANGTAVFGAVPSTIDAAPALADNADAAPRVRHFPGAFGALSEGGMALTVTIPGEPVTKTKIDVPFASVTATAAPAHEGDSGRDVSSNDNAGSGAAEVREFTLRMRAQDNHPVEQPLMRKHDTRLNQPRYYAHERKGTVTKEKDTEAYFESASHISSEAPQRSVEPSIRKIVRQPGGRSRSTRPRGGTEKLLGFVRKSTGAQPDLPTTAQNHCASGSKTVPAASPSD